MELARRSQNRAASFPTRLFQAAGTLSLTKQLGGRLEKHAAPSIFVVSLLSTTVPFEFAIPMLLGEEQCRRKRPREEAFTTGNKQQQRTKRRKTKSPDYPPRFWDTLSRVPLTRRALREFDRRDETTSSAPVARAVKSLATRRLLRSDTRRLLQFANNGGPDLSALQGFSAPSIIDTSMSQSSSQSRKRDYASSTSKSSATGKTKTTTPYSGEFEQKLIDQRVFPDGHRTADGRRPPKPNNAKEIRDALSRPRSSLSPSAFSEDAFEEFQDNNRKAKSESNAMVDVLPVIVGLKDTQYNSTGDVPFHRLEKFDPDISVPKPDRYYGARPVQIDGRVRRDLNEYIIPSNRTSLPAAPNFFLEGKSASARPDVAQRQAMYDGAIGARGMLYLQNHSNATPVHDGNAYTIAATYCDGQLKMYTTHPRESTTGETEYYMTQLDAYAMTGNIHSFRNGAAAYRNAREWTQQQRDLFIANANAAAQRTSTEPASASQTESNAGASSTAAGGSFSSETSADELALDHGVTTKRRRPALSR